MEQLAIDVIFVGAVGEQFDPCGLPSPPISVRAGVGDPEPHQATGSIVDPDAVGPPSDANDVAAKVALATARRKNLQTQALAGVHGVGDLLGDFDNDRAIEGLLGLDLRHCAAVVVACDLQSLAKALVAVAPHLPIETEGRDGVAVGQCNGVRARLRGNDQRADKQHDNSG